MPISPQNLAFDGALLQRGFWLYVWEITHNGNRYYYVGRTGDSSSAKASSPLNRVGLHFDIRRNAKANSLLRKLKTEKINPSECHYRMLAIGPLYKEQDTFKQHKPYRDIIATIEHQVAQTLKNRGLIVLGKHYPSAKLKKKTFCVVMKKIDGEFFDTEPQDGLAAQAA